MRKRPNVLQVRIQALKVPARMSKETYLRGLLKAIDTGVLPRGVEVELHWRNPNTITGRTKNWQSDDFNQAIADSSAGFSGVVRRAIEQQIRKARGEE